MRDLAQSGFFSDPTSAPRLILIDGLDECNNEDQRAVVLHAIVRAIRVHGLPFIFLISSRPETDIVSSFNSGKLVGLWNFVSMDDDDLKYQGIRLFLQDSFRSIKETTYNERIISARVARRNSIQHTGQKSSGPYIYPSTVHQIHYKKPNSPVKALDVLLGVRPAQPGKSPFAELDALYMHILSSVEDTALMLDILAILMGYFISWRLRLSLHISNFLCVDQDEVEGIILSLARSPKLSLAIYVYPMHL